MRRFAMQTPINPPPAALPVDLLQHQQTAVVLLDAAQRVCYLNEAAETLFQVSLARVQGNPVEALLRIDPDMPLDKVLESAATFTQREGNISVPGVGELQLDYSITPILEPQPGHLLLEFHNQQHLHVFDRHLNLGRDEQRKGSQGTTRMLIRGLAHEVKNPLGGIRGSAQLLESELADAEQKEYTRVIIEEADRLRDLVDRLLGPTQPPRTGMVNIHQVLERVVRLQQVESDGKRGSPETPEIMREYDPSLPELRGDRDQLIQALLNVLRNACQALSDTPQPVIRLRTQIIRRFTIHNRLYRLGAQIDIEDNGPGIPADLQERMFLPMISGRADGSGLGLAITETIVGQHGGLIGVESQPGHTCFSIFLPLTEPERTSHKANFK
ncbi:MAG: nitrogen regulation protein NR(II) [Pseudomonadota bacterium]